MAPYVTHRVRLGAGEHQVMGGRAVGVFIALAWAWPRRSLRSPRLAAQDPGRDAEALLSRHLRLPARRALRDLRITRYVDAGGDIDKLEVLDGVAREICARADSIRCYLPESRVVKLDRRTAERDFPALLPERLNELARHYDIKPRREPAASPASTARRWCSRRRTICATATSSTPTRAAACAKGVTLDSSGDTVEQFMFTQRSSAR